MTRLRIKIIYEDKDILVIDKPSGISVHGDGRTKEKTVADWILKNYPKMKNVGEHIELSNGEKILRPGIVHRLDKDTSGVMVVAKTELVRKFLKKQFEEREIKKVYRAVVYGKIKDDNGMIDKSIGRSGSDFRAKMTGSGARGEMRKAITYYKVLERFPEYTYLELRPKTGRTHQIRVHLKSIGRPIICDEIYAKGKTCPIFFGRLGLHAFSIEFQMPNEEIKRFESPMARDLEGGLDKLRTL